MDEVRSVLIIDGNRADRDLIRQALPDWEVLEATNGLQGLDLARAYGNGIDLIIMELDLTGMDGSWTCLQMRAELPMVCVIPYTSRDADTRLTDALGCARAIVKPASVATIRAQVATVLPWVPDPQTDSNFVRFVREQARREERQARLRMGTTAELVQIAGKDQIVVQGLAHLVTQVWRGPIASQHAEHDLAAAAAVGLVTVAEMVNDLRRWVQCPLIVAARSTLEGLGAYHTVRQTGGGIVMANQAIDVVLRELDAALTAAQQGTIFLSPGLAAVVCRTRITPRESEFLLVRCTEDTVEAIAHAMGVDVKTVHQYRRRLREKLGIALS
jgi:DNA-binding NarL/FixJ family response regulator